MLLSVLSHISPPALERASFTLREINAKLPCPQLMRELQMSLEINGKYTGLMQARARRRIWLEAGFEQPNMGLKHGLGEVLPVDCTEDCTSSLANRV